MTRVNPIRILIQDRSRLFRECCKSAFESTDLRVLGDFPDGKSLVDGALDVQVDALLREVVAVPWNLHEMITQLRRIQDDPIFVGIRDSDHEVSPIEGVAGVNRSASVNEFVAALCGRHIEGKRKSELSVQGEIGKSFSLTEREYQVLLLIANGFTTQEIGKRLRLSPKTIESRRQTLFSKLGVQNQSHAVAVAVHSGLLGGMSLPAKSI